MIRKISFSHILSLDCLLIRIMNGYISLRFFSIQAHIILSSVLHLDIIDYVNVNYILCLIVWLNIE